MPRISVIVPTRKRNHLLPRSLGSLFAQTFQDFEIVIVDDNPAPERIKQDAGLAQLLNRPQVRIVEHESPKNASAARNCGLMAAAGEWVTYLDDDDAYEPTKLEKQWRRAVETQLPLGICGMAYHLAKRCRRRAMTELLIPRKELLLAPFCFPAVFHRRADQVRFDETLFAGEDAHYFFQLVRFFNVDYVFNVPEALVDIYPQPGPRVNLNREALWQANMAVYRDFASDYGMERSQLFLSRAELQDCKYRTDGYFKTLRCAIRLAKVGGPKELRLILNTFVFKIPALRRFVVS